MHGSGGVLQGACSTGDCCPLSRRTHRCLTRQRRKIELDLVASTCTEDERMCECVYSLPCGHVWGMYDIVVHAEARRTGQSHLNIYTLEQWCAFSYYGLNFTLFFSETLD